MKNIVFLSIMSLSLTGCKILSKSHTSQELNNYTEQKGSQQNMGQVRFIFDAMGTLNLQGLIDTRIIPTKVYNTALIIAEEKENQNTVPQTRADIHRIMQEYGFVLADKIANWDHKSAAEPEMKEPVGFVTTMVDDDILGYKVKVQISNITCAACHGSVEYTETGAPTQNAWLGTPNTSINFDGYLGQIYRGLVIGLKDKTNFMAKLRSLYPEVDSSEIRTIEKYLFPRAASVLKKMEKMNRVFPFENGGPGITNGISAFKNNANLFFPKNTFHPEENGFVGVPDISLRGFRSSLTIDGAYAHLKSKRFYEVDAEHAQDPRHLDQLAELANFFTFSAMGNVESNLKASIPSVKEIFQWLKNHEAQPFAGEIDEIVAMKGASHYQNKCAQCHGTYSSGIHNVKLLSFPNKLVKQNEMNTDDRRWKLLTPDIKEYSDKKVFSQYIVAGTQMGGYVAPILSGLWTSAPYLHNGSVPTLWDLMNPELRPTKFEYGGHALDMSKIGLRLEKNVNGVMMLAGPKKRVRTQIYDTTQEGRSNRGHEKEFSDLNESEKRELLEYLKLL